MERILAKDPTVKSIVVWLASVNFLVVIMVFVGGLTRLTNSGLSIVVWEPITGIIPPLSQHMWIRAFEAYQQFPEFNHINHKMTLNEFKFIYYWEYFHRMLGRLTGLVFFIPFICLKVSKKVPLKTLYKIIFCGLLLSFQGFLGWYMVKSGLIDRPAVSHLRLGLHLCVAFVLVGMLTWIKASLLLHPNKTRSDSRLHFNDQDSHRTWKLWALVGLIFIQVLFGAFTAGLHAGKLYNTFPGFNGLLIPKEFKLMPLSLPYLLQNPIAIQFAHRVLAILILVLAGFVVYKFSARGLTKPQRVSLLSLSIAVTTQILLGVATLVTQVPITLASCHQMGAVFLWISAILTLFCFRQVSQKLV